MRHPLPLFLPVLLVACAEGGEEDRVQGEVRIAASHHMIGLRAMPGFVGFPIQMTEVFPDRGLLHMADDSTYTVARASGTSAPNGYALARNGELNMFVSSTGTPTDRFPGAYGLMGNRGDFFFVDRWVTQSSPSLGLFCGTKLQTGTVEMAGFWHLFSLHVLFPQGTPITSPDNVARATWGRIEVPADTGTPPNPGSQRTIQNGSGMDSANRQIQFAGSTIQYIVQGGSGDGSLNLVMNYIEVGPPPVADARVFQKAAVGHGAVFAADTDETDDEAGLLFLVKQFDTTGTPPAPADPDEVAGEFLVGALTFFVNPAVTQTTRPGTDGAVGRLTLGDPSPPPGTFRFDMVGSRNIEFVYQGTYVLLDEGSGFNGGLVLTVSGTNEVWHGAISTDYNAVFVVDHKVETRPNPELNLFVGVREKPPEPPPR